MEKPHALPAEPHVVAAPSTLTVVAVILLASCASTARSPLCGEDGLQKGWLKIEQVSLPVIQPWAPWTSDVQKNGGSPIPG